MSLAPLLTAPLLIQLHVIAAVCAVILGPIALLRRSRDIWHTSFGYAWITAMAGTALTSFCISAELVPGPISPIHLLSAWTIWSLWQGIQAARQRRIDAHQRAMRSLYFWAIGIAGLFTFLPGRRMNTVFFGEASTPGFLMIAILIGASLAWYAYVARKPVA